ncbi:MAG: SusC/RagA family TonB-linked outer membrane protein [Flavicella sp.]
MKFNLNVFLGLLFVLCFQITNAQKKTITGTVSDSSESLPGVVVIIKGTTVGTETDFDGNYTIQAEEGAILQFSYIGLKSQEITVGASDSINVILKEDTQALKEVVVVGYGTSTKEAFSGSIKTVDAEIIESKAVSNVTQALIGEAAGVKVMNNSGQPGAEANVRIRGFGSLSGGSNPLYVVDGIPYDGYLNAINPADITSTTILKDATATAIYGSRGANGVILITTNKGKSGTSYIDVSYNTGINMSLIPRYETIKSPEEFMELSWEGIYNEAKAKGSTGAGEFASNNLFYQSGDDDGESIVRGINDIYNMWNAPNNMLIDPSTGKFYPNVTRKYTPKSWEDEGFQTSVRQEANLKMGGGTEKTRYYTSFGYLNDVGYIKNSDFTRLTARLNMTSKVKPWLDASTNLSYSYAETNDNGQSSDSSSIFWFVDNIPSIFPVYERDRDGNRKEDTIYGGYIYDYGENGRPFGAFTNSIADATYNKSVSVKHEIIANASANIKFTDYLTLENSFGVQFLTDTYKNFQNISYGSSAGMGSLYQDVSGQLVLNGLNLLRFKNNFGAHSVEALVAHEFNMKDMYGMGASMFNLVHPFITELSNATESNGLPFGSTDGVRLESYFGQLNYNFDQKYFFTASFRSDGSSRFVGKENQWDNFGSVGASWVLTKETFMDEVAAVDFLKFKTSYGLIGEQNSLGNYPSRDLYSTSGLEDQLAVIASSPGGVDLTWETSKMFQTGIEATLFKNFDINIDYYKKQNTNALINRRIGPSVGYLSQRVNDGVLENSGIEFDVLARVINQRNFGLNIGVNGELLTNKLTTMPIDPSTGVEKILNQQGGYALAKGKSIYDFYIPDWLGVDPSDGTSMWSLNYYDADNNGIPTRDENGSIVEEEQIRSLFEYRNEYPDREISETITKEYPEATNKYIGKSAIPKVRGGFRLSGRAYSFDISTQFLYSIGGYSYDSAYAGLMDNGLIGSNNYHTDIRDRWQEPGDITNVPRLSNLYDLNVASSSSRFLTRADYLTLNNVQIGYTMSKSWCKRIGIAGLRISATGDNLFLMSARDGFNPSLSLTGSSDTYRYSPLSTFTLGLKVKF